MDSSTYIAIIIMWIIIIYVLLHNRRAVIAKKIIKNRKAEGNTEMKELAKRFMNKECVIYSFDSNHQFDGVIKEVTDGAILLKRRVRLKPSIWILSFASESIREIKKERKNLK